MMNHPHAMPEVTGEGPPPSFNPTDEGSLVATSVNAPASTGDACGGCSGGPPVSGPESAPAVVH